MGLYGSTDAPSPGRFPSEMVDRRGPTISEDVRWMSLAGAEGARRLMDVGVWRCGDRWCASPRPRAGCADLLENQEPMTVQHGR